MTARDALEVEGQWVLTIFGVDIPLQSADVAAELALGMSNGKGVTISLRKVRAAERGEKEKGNG